MRLGCRAKGAASAAQKLLHEVPWRCMMIWKWREISNVRLILHDGNAASGRLRALRDAWAMTADEMAGCFGAERRAYQRWERAELDAHLQEAQGANGAVDVLLRHYENGGDTPHSEMMKWVQKLRTGCERYGPFPNETEWKWEFTYAKNRNTPHETRVWLPNILVPMQWGIRWPNQRIYHLQRLLRNTDDQKEQDVLFPVITHYRSILTHYEDGQDQPPDHGSTES